MFVCVWGGGGGWGCYKIPLVQLKQISRQALKGQVKKVYPNGSVYLLLFIIFNH